MIRFIENQPLKDLNTFRMETCARYFLEFSEPAELQQFLQDHPVYFEEILILGGGSNLLFTGDFRGMIIHPAVPGIVLEREESRQVWVRAGAGVLWDDFVRFAVNRGWGGVENLSLIPGMVGAVPVQNIGAYGQETGQVIESVTGVELNSGAIRVIPVSGCHFSYRNSIFKQELQGKFVVTSVVFRLDKEPELLMSYGDVAEKVRQKGNSSLATIREAIMEIRREKLPDPVVLGNAGSFFKNPVMENKKAHELLVTYPDMPVYREGEDFTKLSAGWLIDLCGWKGFRRGDAGVHTGHALVLVNYGKATGKEIYDLSEEIRNSVRERFGIKLEREVQVL